MTEEEALKKIKEIRESLSEKNNDNFLRRAYRAIVKIAKAPSQQAQQTSVKPELQSKKNDSDSLRKAYEILGSIAESQPQLAEQVLKTYKLGLQSEKNDVDSLNDAYYALGNIAKAKPQLAEQVLETFKIGLQSEKNNGSSLYDAYLYLGEIAKAQPQLTEQVFETFKLGLQSEKNNAGSLNEAYITLSDIVKVQPQLAEQLFETFKLGLQSEKNDEGTLNNAYKILGEIAKAQPQLAGQVLETFKLGLQSEKNNGISLYCAYLILGDIVKVQPQLAEQVFETFKLGLRSEKNDEESLSEAYHKLGEIAEEQPQLAGQVLETFKLGLRSEKNDCVSLDKVYDTLGEITKVQPQLAGQVLETLQIWFQSKEISFASALDAYKLIRGIIKAQPELSSKALITIKKDLQTESSREPYLALRSCMQNLPLAETIAQHPEIAKKIQLVHKGRFSTDKEFDFAIIYLDKEELADSNLFRAQQHAMNVLVSTSAQESGIAKEDAEAFRRPDAPQKVKEYVESNQAWLIPASFEGAAIFKDYFPSYIKTILNHNRKNPEDALSIHDAVYWLPIPMSKEANERFSQFIRKNIIYQNAEHKMVHRPLNELSIIAENWEALENKLKNQDENSELAKLKYSDVLSACMSVQYEDQRHNGFAIEAANHGVSEEDYHEYEDIYLAGLKVPKPFDSKKEFKAGEYTARLLPPDDVRTGFFGSYTDCCQHFGGAGHSCAVSTVKHPFSQLFVVENKQGEIIAGSWVWENTEGNYREACFDNIEIKGDFTKDRLHKLKKTRDDSVSEMIECLDRVDAPEFTNLWKEYFQILKDCDIRTEESAEAQEGAEHLKKISQEIDNKLQTKTMKSLPEYELIAETWKSHKEAQQYYANHKKVADAIEKLYEQAGQYLISPEVNCRRVTIGKGYQDADVSKYQETEAIPLPQLYGKDGTDDYSDARSQVLLAENPNAEPLDKTKETQRYIRDVCYLDKEAMEMISEKVFPDSDKKLQAPDNMSGYVIEDREKGVVGYCLYNKEEKSIYDMAVLPEYREDKNASSKKLFAEMIRTITKVGGEWSAEMRDITTLKYLEIMAARGLVKFEKHGVDHVMSDGSKVVSVTFTPIRRDVVNAMAHAKSKIQPQDDAKSAATIPLQQNNRTTLPRFIGRNSNENTA